MVSGLINPGRPSLAAVAVAALWVAAVIMGTLAVSSLAGIRAGSFVNIAQTLAPLALAGSVAVLLAAAGLRRWVLVAVAVALVGSYVALVLPAVRPAGPGGPGEGPTDTGAADPRARLRVFSANLRHGNPDARPIAREVLESGADVVVLQEVTDAHVASMRAEGVLDAYPFALLDPRGGAMGSAILSRAPIADARVADIEGLPLSEATLSVGGRPVQLFNVHTMSPMGRDHFDLRDRQLAALSRLVDRRPEAPAQVFVGDFNANRWHPAFHRLLDSGLRDAHEGVGRGLARTWPNGSVVPTFALLDHVLVSPSVGAVSVREGSGRGSDHRPVVADLVLP